MVKLRVKANLLDLIREIEGLKRTALVLLFPIKVEVVCDLERELDVGESGIAGWRLVVVLILLLRLLGITLAALAVV